MVVSKSEESFDPERVREFLKKSGFTVPKLELTVSGRLEKWKDMPALRVPGLEQVLVLGGGEELGNLQRKATAGGIVQVTGLVHPSHGDEPAGVTVQGFSVSTGEK